MIGSGIGIVAALRLPQHRECAPPMCPNCYHVARELPKGATATCLKCGNVWNWRRLRVLKAGR